MLIVRAYVNYFFVLFFLQIPISEELHYLLSGKIEIRGPAQWHCRGKNRIVVQNISNAELKFCTTVLLENSGHGSKNPGHGSKNSGHGSKNSGHGLKNSGHGSKNSGQASKNLGHTSKNSGHASKNSGHIKLAIWIEASISFDRLGNIESICYRITAEELMALSISLHHSGNQCYSDHSDINSMQLLPFCRTPCLCHQKSGTLS